MALQYELKKQGDFLFRYRSFLPVIIVLIGLFVYIQEASYSLNITNDKTGYEIACFAICLFGLMIRIFTVGYSSDNTSGRNTVVGQVADSINQTGIYSLCRHPLYVGNFFMWVGIAGFTHNFWFIVAFIFMYWIYYERIMYAEEGFLTRTYGKVYLDYADETPAVIPEFNHWKPNKNNFSWVKVIRQEKSGILNLFLVIFVFKAVRWLWLDIPIESYWVWGLGFGVLWYIIIKTIQKTTTLLEMDR